MTGLIDLTGQRFGRLVAVKRVAALRKSKEAWWKCHCDCGNTKETTSRYLRTGIAKSCGCFASEVTAERNRQGTKHGEAARVTPEYRAWASMKSRCYNEKCAGFKLWGGRGIIVCDRWLQSFDAFLADVGRRPSSRHSIDRINNDGNYEPGNVRWATQSEQSSKSPHIHKKEKGVMIDEPLEQPETEPAAPTEPPPNGNGSHPETISESVRKSREEIPVGDRGITPLKYSQQIDIAKDRSRAYLMLPTHLHNNASVMAALVGIAARFNLVRYSCLENLCAERPALFPEPSFRGDLLRLGAVDWSPAFRVSR